MKNLTKKAPIYRHGRGFSLIQLSNARLKKRKNNVHIDHRLSEFPETAEDGLRIYAEIDVHG